MNWQVKYAIKSLNGSRCTAEYLHKDSIKLSCMTQPDEIVIISGLDLITEADARKYLEDEPEAAFLCGYRSTCIWEGGAISFLMENGIGWGNFAALNSAYLEGGLRTAFHKVYAFSYRLIKQYDYVINNIELEFDRVYRVTLKNNDRLRIGLLAEYQPTADCIRSFWDTFGQLDVIWNINPNGNPTKEAIQAGEDLGCKILKWENLKIYLKSFQRTQKT